MLRREPGIAAASGRYQLLCQDCGIQGTAGTRQCQVEGTSCCVNTAVYRGLQALDSVKCCGWVSITPQGKLATSTVNINLSTFIQLN